MGFIGQNNLSSFADGTWGFKWPRFNRLFWESYKQCVIFGTLITPALVVGFCVFADEMKSERSRNFVGWIVSGFGIIGLLLRPALLGLLEDPSMWSVLTIAFMITFGFGMTRVFVRPFDWDTIVIVWLTGGAAFVWILLVKAAFNSEGNPSGTLGWFRLCLGLSLFLGLSIYLGAVCYRLGRFGIVKDTDREPVGSVSASKRDGFPVLAWVQEIGTNATKASEHSRVGFKMLGGVIAAAAFLGLLNGGVEDMFFFGSMAAFLGSFGLRGVHAQGLNANNTIQFGGLTEQERRDETIPITKREDCEVWVQLQSGEPVFCLSRGDRLAGTMTMTAQIPLRELGNFETSTHSAWLRSATEIDARRDWGVIINETANSGVVVIAEWVHAPRWLTELRGMLGKSFDGVERERILAAAEETKRQTSKDKSGTTEMPRPATTANVTPKRKF